MITLVLGGRRSGKSAWAEDLALDSRRQELVYIATCSNSDSSMGGRIHAHQERRKNQKRNWTLIEEPLRLSEVMSNADALKAGRLLFIDCITLWLSNLLENEAESEIKHKISELCQALGKLQNDAIIISNEVGMGLAPATELGNKFIDLAGFANQELARVADEVAFIAAGLPIYLKK